MNEKPRPKGTGWETGYQGTHLKGYNKRTWLVRLWSKGLNS